MKKSLIVLVMLLGLFLSLSLANLDTGAICLTTADCGICESSYNFQFRCYCSLSTSTCWLNTSSINNPQNQSNLTAVGNNQQFPAANLGAGNTFAGTGQAGAAAVTVESVQASLVLLQQRIATSEINTQQQISSLQANLNSLQQQVSPLSSQLQSLSLQGSQVGSLRSELTTVSSGLAALQQNLDSTKSELSSVEDDLKKAQKRTKLLSGALFSIIALAVAATVVYFISGTRRKINPHVLGYITEHLRKGNKYEQIKSNLQEAGWTAEDIDWAYHKTVKHHYAQNKRRLAGEPEQQFDSRKIAVISVISILVIVSVVFLIRGITTGQAIQFPTQEELANNVLQSLQANIANNQFYPLVQSALICVEVKDGPRSVSFRIVKAASGHNIDSAPRPCSEDSNYNAAVKFTGWNSFERMMNDFTCRTARDLHLGSNKGVYVLPSQLVLPGFRLNPQVNYTPFCPLLRSCLTSEELTVLGCS